MTARDERQNMIREYKSREEPIPVKESGKVYQAKLNYIKRYDGTLFNEKFHTLQTARMLWIYSDGQNQAIERAMTDLYPDGSEL
jgi:hypothetical protein